MQLSDFVPAFLILVLVAIQLVSQQAIIPKRFSFRLVAKAKRPPYYRFVIRFWLTIAMLYCLGVVTFRYYTG